MLPQLRQLERRFPAELAVIGVHAGKFTQERETANIRQAMLRLGVEHPVANDRLFRTWRAYAVSAWPTVVLIDPEGRVADTHPGEIVAEAYEPAVAALVEEFDRRGALDRRPLPTVPEAAAEPVRPLRFPGKVLAAGERLFIADSGHHRVLAVALSPNGTAGTVEATIGRGSAGLADGGFEEAAFQRPQGLALLDDTLYVADAENHAIRAVDLARRRVDTVAGTGEPLHNLRLGGYGPRMPLSSPWDIATRGRELYIAMAGTHQLWRLDLGAMELAPYAGSGAEALADGPARSAALAQPMGLTVGDGLLYSADSESSAIRVVEPGARPLVRTIVGTGLFDFGDRDGVGDEALLQHPQGLAWHEGLLYVADTYNNRIKLVDPQSRRAQAFLGSGEPGYRDGPEPQFWEPGGLSVSGGRLYVADTNNHAIRVVDMQTREAGTLRLG